MADNRVWVLGKGIIPITNTQTQNTQKNCVLCIGYWVWVWVWLWYDTHTQSGMCTRNDYVIY